MKPFHIDRELEGPILFKDVLSCLRTSYPILERPNTVLECSKKGEKLLKKCWKNVEKKVEKS